MQLTKYGPKSGISPTVGDPCPLCGSRFAPGEFTTLVRRTRDGRYANDAAEVHWDCAMRRWPKATGGSTP